MSSINDYKTPRDRVSENFLNQLLREESQMDAKATFLGVGRVAAPNCRCGNQMESAADCRVFDNNKNVRNRQSLAMVYSPVQEFTALYCEEEALSKGSLFEELYLPFEAYCCGKKNYGKCGGMR